MWKDAGVYKKWDLYEEQHHLWFTAEQRRCDVCPGSFCPVAASSDWKVQIVGNRTSQCHYLILIYFILNNMHYTVSEISLLWAGRCLSTLTSPPCVCVCVCLLSPVDGICQPWLHAGSTSSPAATHLSSRGTGNRLSACLSAWYTRKLCLH